MSRKDQVSFYISKEVKELIQFLKDREEISKVVFYRRALRLFFEEEPEIDPRILITKRSHPDYVRRDVQESVEIEPEYRVLIKQLAKEKECSEGQVIFMAVLNYCAVLLSIDSTGVSFK